MRHKTYRSLWWQALRDNDGVNADNADIPFKPDEVRNVKIKSDLDSKSFCGMVETCAQRHKLDLFKFSLGVPIIGNIPYVLVKHAQYSFALQKQACVFTHCFQV